MMDVEKFYETLTKLVAEKEGVNINVKVERREDDENTIDESSNRCVECN